MAGLWIQLCLVLLHSVTAYATNPSVQLFQKYVQINTTTHGNLTPAVEFWSKLASEEALDFRVLEFERGYPVVVIKCPGADPSLGSIMLNSHMDVVPANESEGWLYPPFSGYRTDDGIIYGRGTQDMKSVSIQYFEALRRLNSKGEGFLRNVFMTLMPDEEVGAGFGMIPFLASPEFADMNVGFELDEAGPTELPILPFIYQDKVVWQIQVDCYGTAAHGSTIPETNSTATGKCSNVINTMFAFRDREYEKAQLANITDAGGYTSVNLNRINAGTADNIIPGKVSLFFDIRLSTTLNEGAFEEQLNEWITEAGDNITLTFILKNTQSPATRVDMSNPYWNILNTEVTRMGYMMVPVVPTGSTDARFVRAAGIPAFGFSPMPSTESLLHQVNERLAESTFLMGIDIYEQFINKLANIPGDQTSPDPSVYIVSTAD